MSDEQDGPHPPRGWPSDLARKGEQVQVATVPLYPMPTPLYVDLVTPLDVVVSFKTEAEAERACLVLSKLAEMHADRTHAAQDVAQIEDKSDG